MQNCTFERMFILRRLSHTRVVHCNELHVFPYDETITIAAFVFLSAYHAAECSEIFAIGYSASFTPNKIASSASTTNGSLCF